MATIGLDFCELDCLSQPDFGRSDDCQFVQDIDSLHGIWKYNKFPADSAFSSARVTQPVCFSVHLNKNIVTYKT